MSELRKLTIQRASKSRSNSNSSLLFDSPESRVLLFNYQAISLSSGVAALSAPGLQLPPEADHVLRRLVVRRVVAVEAAGLEELDVVRILHRLASLTELLNPHAHAHVLHLEQLHQSRETRPVY